MYSACVSIPSRSVSTETPRQTVSSFDHLVTQWMSRVISSLGRARNSSQVQPRGWSRSPIVEKSHSRSGVCGVGPAERTGKSRVTYWPGGTRAGSTFAARRPQNPRETNAIELDERPVEGRVEDRSLERRRQRLRQHRHHLVHLGT